MIPAKITPKHLKRTSYSYIRQSAGLPVGKTLEGFQGGPVRSDILRVKGKDLPTLERLAIPESR